MRLFQYGENYLYNNDSSYQKYNVSNFRCKFEICKTQVNTY